MVNSNDLSEPRVVGGDGVKRRGLKERVKGVRERVKRVRERVKREKVEGVGESIEWVVNY